jgi:hypothetical protein
MHKTGTLTREYHPDDLLKRTRQLTYEERVMINSPLFFVVPANQLRFLSP